MQMGNRDDQQLILEHVVNQSVRKAAQAIAPQLRSHRTPRHWMTLDALQASRDFLSEVVPETALRGLVLRHRLIQFRRRNFEQLDPHAYLGFLTTWSASMTCSSPRL